MYTTEQYLEALQRDIEAVKTNLTALGVEINGDETLTQLAAKVNTIPAGDVDAYFEPGFGNSAGVPGSSTFPGWTQLIKKLPPIIIGRNVSSMAYMFARFQGSVIPTINMLSEDITDFSYCFQECRKLIKAPELDTSKSTNFSAMFAGDIKLESVPLYDTSNGKNFSYMFQGVNSLEEVPQLNTANGQLFNYMFGFQTGTAKLKTIPKLDMSSAINISKMIYTSSGGNGSYLLNLTNLGGFENLGKAYSTTASANNSNYTLEIVPNVTTDSYNNLTHESLMNVINGLYDIASAGVATQKLMLGALNLSKLTAEEIAIATNKGWTVS